jgi:hypothetical protein
MTTSNDTPSGNETATFRRAAQCLNQLRHQQRASLLTPNSNYFNSIARQLLLSVSLQVKTECLTVCT